MVKYVSYNIPDGSHDGLPETKLPYGLRGSSRRKARHRKFSEEGLKDKLAQYKAGTLTDKMTYDQFTWLECIARTDELVVGERYWISQNWENTGAFVKILEKSTKLNPAGLPSSVRVEVVQTVGAHKVGEVKTMNATQIYDERDHSSKENFRKSLHAAPFSLVGAGSG
tara:strand:+ start:235 stop:738 length:504 start_codon:yes stop_codon:yes gene_type:complete